MQFAIIAFHISMHLTAWQTTIASESALSSLVRNDVLPSGSPWKTIVSSSKVQCAAHCLSAAECKSFYYGNDECGLLKTQYSANDKLLDKKVGFSYYHFNVRLEATITEEVETTEVTNTPQATTTTSATSTTPATTTTSATTTTTATTPKAVSYVFYAEAVSFDDAFKSCKDKKARLVCAHDNTTWQAVLQVVNDNGNPRYVWIGLNGTVRTDGEDYDLQWADGVQQNQNTKFQLWMSTEYPKENVCCVEIARKKWKDQTCSAERPYICEHPK